MHDERTVNWLVERFAEHGIARHRLTLVDYQKHFLNHLGSYRMVDISLDSFPYNGTTITCESLWMGVPVVTRKGGRHAARVGASLLARIGLDDLVAEDDSAFVDIACRLASDHKRLAALRMSLRERLCQSPLGNPSVFTPTLESAYRQLWHIWLEQNPSHFGTLGRGDP